jgi:caffeoyl-CoA O-methyltransferase
MKKPISWASKYFQRSAYAKQIELKTGDATKLIPTLTQTFDIAFIDADKRNYTLYFDLIIDKVKKGGLIITDNVLWSGKSGDARERNGCRYKSHSRFQ